MLWTIKNASRYGQRLLILMIVAFMTSVLGLLIAADAHAARQASTLSHRLDRKVTATWQRQELGVAIKRLAEVGDFEIWLDRRIDQQQRVSIQITNESIRQALATITKDQALGFAEFDKLIYVGPKQIAEELQTLVQHARHTLARQPSSLRKRWLRSNAVQWQHLGEPRQLVESWLESAGFRHEGAERISHDLWTAKSLPPMPMVDRIALVLAGFDLTCRISPDGMTCQIVPISRPFKIATRVPQTNTKPQVSSSGERPDLVPSQRFTLQLQNQPLGRVIDQLATQLNLQIDWSESLKTAARDRLVSCTVNQVTLEELLKEILNPADLESRREGSRVTITRRTSDK